MGFLGMGNYAKPGPGISKNAPRKKRFFLFWELLFRKFGKLVWLNILYILCCIPLVTIGPATAGFTYVLRNFAREEHAFVTSDFFEHGFKKNWKQALVISLIDGLVIFLLVNTIYFYFQQMKQDSNLLYPIALGISLVVCYIFLSMNYFVYILMVTMDLKIRHLIKNSFILGVLSLKTSFLTTLFLALTALILFLFFPITMIIILVIGFSFMGFIIVFNSYPYVQKYVINPALGVAEDGNSSETTDGEETIFEDLGDEKDLKDDQ